MIRVHVICEGQTEEMFVNEILCPFFDALDIWLRPALVGKPGHKGGRVKFERLRIDLQHRLLGDQGAYCTTLFDFYGLPMDFPGKLAAAHHPDIKEKAAAVCNAMIDESKHYIAPDSLRRFIPYVQMYEFEALILSEPSHFQEWFDSKASDKLKLAREEFLTPEHINDSPQTAPSKRILQCCVGYEKPLHGSLIAMEIGLETMRRECRLFNQWLEKLSALTALAQD